VDQVAKSAFIEFVHASTTSRVELDDVKAKFERYVDMTTKTGQQLDWGYVQRAFPYSVEQKPEGEKQWFYLKGKDPKQYKYIIVGVGSGNLDEEAEEQSDETDEQPDAAEKTISDEQEDDQQHFIQIVLPDGATHGDVSKANEFCKFLAKEYKAKLRLFNGRVMYYYPRKP
jgi:hypothetical protein